MFRLDLVIIKPPNRAMAGAIRDIFMRLDDLPTDL
jgi:hypothetical protein